MVSFTSEYCRVGLQNWGLGYLCFYTLFVALFAAVLILFKLKPAAPAPEAAAATAAVVLKALPKVLKEPLLYMSVKQRSTFASRPVLAPLASHLPGYGRMLIFLSSGFLT